MKTNKQKITIVILAIAYIGIGKYQQNKEQKQLAIFQQGAQYGYQQAIIQIMQQAATCQQVPIFMQNQTINIIALECLRQKD